MWNFLFFVFFFPSPLARIPLINPELKF